MSKDSRATQPDTPSSSTGGHTLTKLGVRVEKSLTKNDGGVPTIRYDVTSGREEPVVVHLIDVLPAEIPEAAIGFHPDYGEKHWEAANGRVEYRRELDPKETVVTVCGVRLPEEMNEQVLLDEPILRVETPELLSDDDAAAGSEDAADPKQTEQGSRPATGRPTSDGGSTTAGKASTRDRATTGEAFGSTAGEHAASGSTPTGDRSSNHTTYQSTPRDGSVAAALAADLRAGRVSEADRRTLQEEFDFDPALASDAVVEQLRDVIQQERANLEAEVETLEKSLYRLYEQISLNDQNIDTVKKILKKLDDGKADVEALEAVRTRLEELEGEAMAEEDLEQLRGVLTELKDAKSETERLAEVETDLARLHSAIPNEERLDRIENGLAELRSASVTRSDLDELRSELQSLEREAVTTADLAELADRSADKSELDRVKSAIEELEDRMVDADEIESMIGQLDGRSADDTSITAVRRELDELRETVEEIDELAADRENVEKLQEYVADLETEGVERSEVIEMMESIQESMPSSGELEALRRRIEALESEKAEVAHVERLERSLDGHSTPTTDGGTVTRSAHADPARGPGSATQHATAAPGPTSTHVTGNADTAADDGENGTSVVELLTLAGGFLATAVGLFFGAVQGNVQFGFFGFAAGAALLTAWAMHRNE